MPSRRGFTLVELLLVVGIIALLIGILLPTLAGVRTMAQGIACRSNLREMGNALRTYANDNRDVFPSKYALGGANYRRRPGLKNVDDPYSLRECYGMPAVLHGIDPKDDLSAGLPRFVRYLPADSKVWVCPAMPEYLRDYGNTYFWNLNDPVMQYKSGTRSKYANREVVVLQDNVSFLPDTPGFRRTSGAQASIATANWVYPHPLNVRRMRMSAGSRLQGAINILFLDGHVGGKVYTYTGGTGVTLSEEVVP